MGGWGSIQPIHRDPDDETRARVWLYYGLRTRGDDITSSLFLQSFSTPVESPFARSSEEHLVESFGIADMTVQDWQAVMTYAQEVIDTMTRHERPAFVTPPQFRDWFRERFSDEDITNMALGGPEDTGFGSSFEESTPIYNAYEHDIWAVLADQLPTQFEVGSPDIVPDVPELIASYYNPITSVSEFKQCAVKLACWFEAANVVSEAESAMADAQELSYER